MGRQTQREVIYSIECLSNQESLASVVHETLWEMFPKTACPSNAALTFYKWCK